MLGTWAYYYHGQGSGISFEGYLTLQYIIGINFIKYNKHPLFKKKFYKP